MARKGKGWHGEASRHSAAAKRGHRKRTQPLAVSPREMSDAERRTAEKRFKELRARMKEIKGGKLYKLPPVEQKEYDALHKESWELYLKLSRVFDF